VACNLSVPETEVAIAASALYSAGGYVVIAELFTEREMAELRAEALAVRPTGIRNEFAEFVPGEGRGGKPQRSFLSALGGQTHWRLFSSPAVIAFIKRITGLNVRPAGSGSYTYYEPAGDFLALHRDIETCDLAVMTCIEENTESGGGRLLVYSQYITESLSAVRAAGTSAATSVRLLRGGTIMLLGGMVPHEVTPTRPGEYRIVSIMCFQVLPNAAHL
jgi:hypothetical protein